MYPIERTSNLTKLCQALLNLDDVHADGKARSNVCHQPHATFLGIHPSMVTCEGMLRSITSPNPSCFMYPDWH